MDKCKNCQWHNKPYWSIINPCDNCSREDKYVEILTRWEDPTAKELQQIIDRAIEYNNHLMRDAKYHLNLGHLRKMKKILMGEDK